MSNQLKVLRLGLLLGTSGCLLTSGFFLRGVYDEGLAIEKATGVENPNPVVCVIKGAKTSYGDYQAGKAMGSAFCALCGSALVLLVSKLEKIQVEANSLPKKDEIKL